MENILIRVRDINLGARQNPTKMQKCRKPRNILEALHARQLGYPNGLFESIFRETCEHLMMGKNSLQRMIRKRVYVNDFSPQINWVAPSPDGMRAACIQQWYINIINISERKFEKSLRSSSKRYNIMWVSWSPKSKGANYIIAASYSNGVVWVWFSDDRKNCSYRVYGGYEYIISFHLTILVLAIVSGADLIFWDIENNTVKSAPCQNDECIIYVQYAPTGRKLLISKEVEMDNDSCYILQLNLVDGVVVEDLQNNVAVLKNVCEKKGNIAVNKQYTMLAAYHLLKHDCICEEMRKYVVVVSLMPYNIGSKLCQISLAQSPEPISFSPTSKYLMFKNNNNDTTAITVVDINRKVIKGLGQSAHMTFDHMFIWSPNIDVGVIMYRKNSCSFLR